MNAGFSARGREWTAEHADISLSPPSERTIDGVARATGAMKRLARERGGRDDLQVWIPCYVVCRPTEREARDYLKHYAVEMADNEALDFAFAQTNPAYESAGAEDKIDMRLHMAAGFSSYPLVGTPEQIAEMIGELADAGLDGLCLTWVDYATELDQWNSEVMPLLERAGLRQPFATSVHEGDRDASIAG
jgi:dimethylsulfone monooxygenase